MSLVNDMLRDLEKRGQGRQGSLATGQLHSVQDQAAEAADLRPNWLLWIVVAALVVGFGVLAWMQWSKKPLATVTVNATPSVAVPQTPVVFAGPGSDTVSTSLRVENVSWQTTAQGGVLSMRFNGVPQVRLLNQTRESVVIALPEVRLHNTLPLPAKTVVSEFNLMADTGRLVLDLKTVRDAHFELKQPTQQQLQLVVVLSAPEVAQPGRSALAVKPTAQPAIVSDGTNPPAKSGPVAKADKAPAAPSGQMAESAAPTSTAVSQARTIKQGAAEREPAKVNATAVKNARTLTDAQAVTKARNLLQKNRLTETQALLEMQVRQVAGVPESRALLASLYLAAGNATAAETITDAGLEESPQHSGLKKVKARILLARNESATAVQLLEHTPPAIKQDAEYHEIRAAALQQQGRSEEAVNVYYQLLKYNSGLARLWVGLGYSLELAARPDESRKAYESSLQVPGIEENLKRYVTQRLTQLAER